MTTTRPVTLGRGLINALAAGDFDHTRGLLCDDVEFVAATPAGVVDTRGRDATLEVLRGWFPPGHVDGVDSLCDDRFHTRHRLTYQVRWRDPDGTPLVFEQHAYYDADHDQITRLHLVCSGDHPVDSEPHRASSAAGGARQ